MDFFEEARQTVRQHVYNDNVDDNDDDDAR